MSEPRIVAGLHSVRNVLRHGADSIREALVDGQRRDRRLKELLSELQRAGIKPKQVSREELDRLAAGINHQGIVVMAVAPAAIGEKQLPEILDKAEEPLLILILDGVQDPHNLGACLRTADAAGVDVVIAPKDRSAGLTP
ncbi:MAG: RNA methyltransferase substrate-binding domain-containing protein, partial [Chromatiales bacterium]